jgi:hypothetical protein
MKKLILTTAALLAGTALAAAQGMNPPAGNKAEGAAPAPAAQQKAPAEKAAPQTAQAPKADSKTGANSEAPKANADSKAGAQGDMKAKEAQKSDTKADSKAAADTKAGDKADTKSATDTKSKTSTDTKAAADDKAAKDGKASAQTDSKSKESTGQGAAGSRAAANISTEQKTKIRTVITEKVKVKPETNVNVSISVGTRVPRTVHYHPLPAEVVTIYPEWRGYYFILVGSQIVILEPSTYEIVYIIA